MASFPNAFVGPVMTSQNDHVTFSLWGCSPAAVLLLEDLLPTPDGFNLYEVSIGRNDNSQVGIYRKEVCRTSLPERHSWRPRSYYSKTSLNRPIMGPTSNGPLRKVVSSGS